MDPVDAAQILRRQDELGPVLATLGVALVGGGAAERQPQTDNETEDGEEERIDAEGLDELGDAGEHGRPSANRDERQNQLRQDAAVHLQEDGPFRVLRNVSRSSLGGVSVLIEGLDESESGSVLRSSRRGPRMCSCD